MTAWLAEGRPKAAAVLLLLATFSVAVLIVEGARPGAAIGWTPSVRHFDKLLHYGAHFWIAGLAFWGAVLLGRPRDPRRRIWLCALTVLLVDGLAGIAIELVQSTLGAAHGRVFDWKDVIANIAGSLTAVAASVFIALRAAR